MGNSYVIGLIRGGGINGINFLHDIVSEVLFSLLKTIFDFTTNFLKNCIIHMPGFLLPKFIAG